MSYWQKLASKLGESDPHPWEQMYADTMTLTDPQLTDNLSKQGEFEAFVKVKVSEALESYQRYLDDDMDPQMAKELALEELMPSDDDDVSDEEVEEGIEDQMDATMRYLTRDMDDDDEDKPKRMALQVGSTINKNGQQYRLNENHRWTRVEQGGQPATKTAQPQPQQQRPPQRPAIAAPKPQNKAPQAPVAPTTPKPQAAPQPSQSVFQGQHNPQVESDPNHDGVTDRARVGVPAFDVPPPPKRVTRIPGLTGVAKRAESHFADAFEKDPDSLTDSAVIMFTAHAEPGKPVVFETDACKNLSPYWKSADLDENMDMRAKNRATLNLSLHQTANAICKRAFVKHLDTLEEGSEILVTVGGCGAGKGYALKQVPQALEMKSRAAVVWDSAGDQNATENPWILQEARKRGLKVNYVFVHADPNTQWANPERGVVKRAQDPNDGRMVDAMVFADSYAIGAKNHHAFAEKHKNDADVRCVYLMNGAQPKLLDTMPPEAMKVDRRALAKFAVDYVNGNPDVPEHIRKGATDGVRIWQD
jgi:hypothetical protein